MMKGFVVAGGKTDALASMHVSSLFSPTNVSGRYASEEENGKVMALAHIW
jgi:hypothetical protein